MPRMIGVILFSSVALLMACGGSSGPLGSCIVTGGGIPFCVDYEAYPDGAAGVKALCAGFNFPYSETPCMQNMRIASCRTNSPNGAQLFYTYYSPATVAEAQGYCENNAQHGATAVFIP
jgi:hypothetical protein